MRFQKNQPAFNHIEHHRLVANTFPELSRCHSHIATAWKLLVSAHKNLQHFCDMYDCNSLYLCQYSKVLHFEMFQ